MILSHAIAAGIDFPSAYRDWKIVNEIDKIHMEDRRRN